MTTFYDYNQIFDLIRHGDVAEVSGTYTLWIWARGGSHVRVTMAGRTFSPTHTEHRSRLFSWVRAGQVDLRKGQHFFFSMETLQPYTSEASSHSVGWIARSSDRRFNPVRSFEVSRVFQQEPDPLQDTRVADVRHVHTPWTLRTYPTREAWEARAAEIRQHILVSLGLWPLPEKTPLNAEVFGRIEQDGYRVEKVYFESLPGFFVCGNLYRPLGRKGPFPGVASPHGHWRNGRLENSDMGSIPGRCINLARQGHVVFSYDMAGYLDSDQIVHRGYGGFRADLWGIGVMGLQLWNSIRVLDFLCSLQEVDPDRMGCTGASGGGTQTFMLAAVDDRVKVAAPVNMVSAHMQGGCTCENHAHLRLDINNIEIAATMAPRPLFLVSATGDWTVNTPELEYPAIREIYRLYDAEERIGTAQVDAPHNYNRRSREYVYAWFGKWFLGIDDPKQFRERPSTVEKSEDLLVFHNRARPPQALDAEGLTRTLIERSEAQFDALRPGDLGGLSRFREQMGPAFRHAISAEYPISPSVRDMGRSKRESYIVQGLLLGRLGQGDRIPALLFIPKARAAKTPGTLVVHPEGKTALADLTRGTPSSVVSDLLKRGHLVLAVDTFLTGEFHSPFGRARRDRDVPHFTTYNRTDTACRVQDILTALAYLRSRPDVGPCNLLGLGAAGPWCLLARALASDVARTAIDGDRFSAEDDGRWVEDLFIPAIRRAGDFRTAAALIAPAPLLVHNAGGPFPLDWISEVYRIAGTKDALQISTRRISLLRILDWLSEG